MGAIKLLDCTLRDGVYVNDWKFGHDNLVSIFERLVDAGIDIIEVGFLDERRPFDPDRSIMPNTDSVAEIYGRLDRKQAMVVGMIDYGTCGLENIRPRSESFLDGIRVIFKKHLREEAIRFCGELKKLGYKVFVQLVSVTSYSDEEMLDLIRLANGIQPYAVSMVDTYGLMHQDKLMHYFELLNERLNESIGLGYHAHNNFQMGYANCIEMMKKKIKRDIYIDGSVYGMGKSAGNAPIELIAMYMNHYLNKSYSVSQILEAIDSNISQFYTPATWGYNMFYYIAAYNDCHPNYVSTLMEKRTLSVKSINEILSKLPDKKKLLYDKKYIEQLYIDFQNNEVGDEGALCSLKKLFEGKELLVLGPGTSIYSCRDKVSEYISQNHPLVISINCVPDGFRPDFVFLTNSKRYVQLATRQSQERQRIIATSNVTGTNGEAFEFVLNYSTLIDTDAEIIDNSLVMMLKVLIKTSVNKVLLAGFDGYSARSENYFNGQMEYHFIREKAEELNRYTINFLSSVRGKLQVEFLTPSFYEGRRQ